MALAIATNNAAIRAAAAASSVNRDMETSMARLSSGKRINSASDDAAGVAISSRLSANIRGTDQAIRNSLDGQALIDTAEGAHKEIENILQRMREIAVQGASGTNTGTNDMAALNTEYEALRDQIFQIVDDTEWNGATLLDGNVAGSTDQTVDYQIGANASQTITVDFGDFETTQNFGSNFTTIHDIDDAGEATTIIGYVDAALVAVNTQRAKYGAAINRLEYAADNLANVSQNTSASRSRILDADYAAETTELARTQIIQQAGTAMLSQANQAAQSVLALLR